MRRRECNICAPAGIDVDTVLKSVLLLARKHEVSIGNIFSIEHLPCIIVHQTFLPSKW